MADTVNAQITDAVTQANVSVLGESPAQSMGMVYQTMAHAMSLLMQNSVASQGGMQQINAAVVASACKQIMTKRSPMPQLPSPTPSPSPSGGTTNTPSPSPSEDLTKYKDQAKAGADRAKKAALGAAVSTLEAQTAASDSESPEASRQAALAAEAAATAAEKASAAEAEENQASVDSTPSPARLDSINRNADQAEQAEKDAASAAKAAKVASEQKTVTDAPDENGPIVD